MARGRHGNRYAGMSFWVVEVGTVVAVVLIAHFYRLGVPEELAALLGALSAVYLSWLGFRQSEVQRGDRPVSEIADDLAGMVRAQWDREAEARSLLVRQLPVRWEQVQSGAPGSLLQRSGREILQRFRIPGILGRKKFKGQNVELARKLRSVPGERVVVLGEAGSGKSVLMVRLVLGLLDIRKNDGGPVPVLVSAASWDPQRQSMRDWLVDQLITDYPALATVPRPPSDVGTLAEALLGQNLVMPVLDGLDELPDEFLGPAVERLNATEASGGKLFVTCRAKPYDAAKLNGQRVRVTGTEVRLLPPVRDDVRRYLTDGDDEGGALASLWRPVTDALHGDGPVAQALTRPLMVDLARAVYVDGHGGPRSAGSPPDPVELCELPTKFAVEQHLCRAYVSGAYRRELGAGHARRAERRLAFLAHHLKDSGASPNLAWWQLQLAVSPAVHALSAGLAAGALLGLGTGLAAAPSAGLAAGAAAAIAAALAMGAASARWRHAQRSPGNRPEARIGRLALMLAIGMMVALAIALMFGLRGKQTALSSGITSSLTAGISGGVAGLACGLVIGYESAMRSLPEPSRGLHWRWSLRAMAIGVGAGIVTGLALGIPYGVAQGVSTGLGVGSAAGFGAGLEAVPPDFTDAASPRGTLRRDRRTSLVIGSLVALAVSAGAAFDFPLVYGTIIGAACGIPFGLVIIMLGTAWPTYTLALAWLALRRRLPWSLMSFLEEAHQKGILRRAGPRYQFRHLELQEHLASMWRPHS